MQPSFVHDDTATELHPEGQHTREHPAEHFPFSLSPDLAKRHSSVSASSSTQGANSSVDSAGVDAFMAMPTKGRSLSSMAKQ